MKKIIFWFFIISFLLLILSKNVNAQQNIYVCENVQANPNLIQATSPQNVVITIQLTGGTQTEIPSNSLKLHYEAEYTKSSTGDISVTEANPTQNPRVIRAQIPSNLLNFSITQKYTFRLMKGNTILRSATGTQECGGSFKVETDPNAELSGPCIYPADNNRFTCRFDGLVWRPESQNSFCDSANNFIINPACNSNNNDPLAFSRSPVCAPCVSLDILSKLKDHGETCNTNANPSECLPTFVCRTSSSSQGKCLYNPHVLELNGQCIVGEDECTLNSTIALPGYRVLTCLADGTCGPAPQNLQTCDSHDICKTTYGNTAFCDFNTGKCIVPAVTPTPPSSSGLSFNPLGSTKICEQYAGSEAGACKACLDKQGLWTPFGCIGVNPQDFIQRLLQISISIAGGIAFLMMVYAGFIMMTSSGNPEKLTHGREIFASAIAGLILIIFSAIILKIIGVDILKIPGFQ